MKPTLTLHRAYFFVVVWFTLWVGFFGFFRPEEILRALPWPIPPLHARFIGSFYLSATVFLTLSMIARTLLEVRTIVIMAFTWTGWLLGITFLHWETFDFSRPQPWFWVFAYITFPIAAAWLSWAGPARPEPDSSNALPSWAVHYLRFQGVLLVLLAAACFFAPSWVASIWPWKISTFLAQVYSGPTLAYGVAGLVLAAHKNWPETRIPALGTFVFAALALVGSCRHLALFTVGSPSKLVWFSVLSVIALGSAVLSILAFQSTRRSA